MTDSPPTTSLAVSSGTEFRVAGLAMSSADGAGDGRPPSTNHAQGVQAADGDHRRLGDRARCLRPTRCWSAVVRHRQLPDPVCVAGAPDTPPRTRLIRKAQRTRPNDHIALSSPKKSSIASLRTCHLRQFPFKVAESGTSARCHSPFLRVTDSEIFAVSRRARSLPAASAPAYSLD